MRLGSQRFEATEILFEPTIGGYELRGLGQMVFESIRVNFFYKEKADANVRPYLYGSILLTGGTTMLPGFSDRLQNDMVKSFQTFVSKKSDTDLKMRIKIDVREKIIFRLRQEENLMFLLEEVFFVM